MKKILVTGSAGFIGFHLSARLISLGYKVSGLDSLNNYYDVAVKEARITNLKQKAKSASGNDQDLFSFHRLDLVDKSALLELCENEQFDYIIHLAAQAGVRYSLENPQAYIDSNLVGFMNVLEACRIYPPRHLIFASSSSVYGLNGRVPFSTNQNTDHPVSLYAATKKANEVIAHSYAHLFNIPVTGLRFFTVYGPWGRPDMAYFSFTRKIYEGDSIEIFNNGDLKRDFTYIDDIVNGIITLLDRIPDGSPLFDPMAPDPSISSAPFRIFNIGNNHPVRLMEFIATLEKVIGIEAKKVFKPMQAGDVFSTHADIESLTDLVGFKPVTSLQTGLRHFVDWYKDYYKPQNK
jgi:UDP-glucuronate 4-epimerase